MSYGPQLPAHLLSKESSNSNTDDDDDEYEQSYGPKLPSTACRGPDPRRQEFSDSGGDNYGPKLPSKPCFGHQKPESISTLFWIIMAVSFIGVPILILLVALKFKISSVVYHRFYDRRARCR